MCDISCIEFGEKVFNSEIIKGKKVLEIGARNVNGSVKETIMRYGPSEYVGIDIEAGENVDIICGVEDAMTKFGLHSFDIVVCTEVLEHIYNWRIAINNIKYLCSPGGYIVITTRSKGFAEHNWPADYWRFEVDDMIHIFSDMTGLLVEADPQNPGVFVFARKPELFTMVNLDGFNLYRVEHDEGIAEDFIEINKGDIVQLKSGGPKMTVDYVYGEVYRCFWFSNESLCSSDFHRESIIPIKENEHELPPKAS